jgi:hypothetical protein
MGHESRELLKKHGKSGRNVRWDNRKEIMRPLVSRSHLSYIVYSLFVSKIHRSYPEVTARFQVNVFISAWCLLDCLLTLVFLSEKFG